MPTLAAHFLPALTNADELAGGVVVVIDVLRASTTIATALAAGADELIPLGDVEQARQKAAELRQTLKQPPILGGERGGLRIDGFDLGNSPNEYTQAVVGGRTVIFTTTNGTQALLICGAARRVLIGSFVNYSAVLRQLTGEVPIHLLCAGTAGGITREDVLFTGALVEILVHTIVEPEGLNDEARIAQDVWRQAIGAVEVPSPAANQRVAEVLRNTQGGRNLLGLGLAADIADAATVDRFDFVPVFDAAARRIVRPH